MNGRQHVLIGSLCVVAVWLSLASLARHGWDRDWHPENVVALVLVAAAIGLRVRFSES